MTTARAKWKLGETESSAVFCVADSPGELENFLNKFKEEAALNNTRDSHIAVHLAELRGPSKKADYLFCRQYNVAVVVAMIVEDILRPPSGLFLPELIANTDAIVVSGRLSDLVMRGYLSKSLDLKNVNETLWSKQFPRALVLTKSPSQP